MRWRRRRPEPAPAPIRYCRKCFHREHAAICQNSALWDACGCSDFQPFRPDGSDA